MRRSALLSLALLAAFAFMAVPSASAFSWTYSPVVPQMGPQVLANVRSIQARGTALGNRPDVFAKVGDSITHSDYFMREMGCEAPLWGQWGWLEPTWRYFGHNTVAANPLDPGACNATDSYARGSVAALPGWTATNVLAPQEAAPSGCEGLSALDCEVKILRPSIALVMFGTNDLKSVDPATFRLNLARVAKRLVARGVIPVISTIPPRLKAEIYQPRVAAFNAQIAGLARNRRLPLWNYWRQMVEADASGYALAPDGVHPSQRCPTCRSADFSFSGLTFGYPLRNLGALRVLQKLRHTLAGR